MKENLVDARFKKNVAFSYITQIAAFGVGFASVTLITRYAGIETYGMISTMTAISGILTNLLTFRTNEAVVKFFKQGKFSNDDNLCRLALVAGLSIDLFMGLLLFLLVNSLSAVIATSLLKHPDMEFSVSLYAFIMPTLFLRGTPIGLLVASERFRLINSINVLEPTMKVIGLFVLVGSGTALTFNNIILTIFIPALIMTAFIYSFLLRELLGPLRDVSISRHHLPEFARFSLSTFLSSSLKAGNQNIDTVILGYLTNPANVGVYNLFRQFLSPVNMIAAPFSDQIYPRFVQAVAEKRKEALLHTIAYANSILFRGFMYMLATILPLLLFYNKWNNLNLTTEHFATFGLMIISAFIMQQLWWSRPLSMSTNPNLSIRAGILACVLLPVFIFIFVGFIGLAGVGIASILTGIALHKYWRKELQRHG